VDLRKSQYTRNGRQSHDNQQTKLRPAVQARSGAALRKQSKERAQIEADLGITPGLLNKWRATFKQQGEHAFPGSGHQTEAEAELRRLRRENEILRQERDILKKAIQVFSRAEP
jgi:transposase